MTKPVRDHIERRIELYGTPIDDEDMSKKTVARTHFEQMRADLMLALGMLSVLNPEPPDSNAKDGF